MSEIDILGLDRDTLNFLKIQDENLERSIKGYKGLYEIGDSVNFGGFAFVIYECGEISFGSGRYFYKAENLITKKHLYKEY